MHQHDGRDTEQIEQVYADGQSHYIGNKHKPFIGMRLIGIVFPFEDEPENNSSEHGGKGVDFSFYGREPECIGKGIEKRTHQPTANHGKDLPHF